MIKYHCKSTPESINAAINAEIIKLGTKIIISSSGACFEMVELPTGKESDFPFCTKMHHPDLPNCEPFGLYGLFVNGASFVVVDEYPTKAEWKKIDEILRTAPINIHF